MSAVKQSNKNLASLSNCLAVALCRSRPPDPLSLTADLHLRSSSPSPSPLIIANIIAIIIFARVGHHHLENHSQIDSCNLSWPIVGSASLALNPVLIVGSASLALNPVPIVGSASLALNPVPIFIADRSSSPLSLFLRHHFVYKMVNKNSEADMPGKNQIEDVRWLCSLSETELDMLIWIKRMVLHRAKKIGHKSLAREFDLKTLRSLSLTIMEHLMDQVKDLSILPSYAEAMKQLRNSNLLRSHVNGDFSSMSSEELFAYICPEEKKRIAEM